jgi:hypothetical protein
MPDIALYYPYTHVRDDSWLKAAALCWPKLAVLASSNYPRRESTIAKSLRDELDFFVDVDPAAQTRKVAGEFIDVILRAGDMLRGRYTQISQLPADYIARTPTVTSDSRQIDQIGDPAVTWLNLEKMSADLIERFLDNGLGVVSHDQAWMGLDPRLADVYLTVLADRVADANGMPLVTDQARAHGALKDWDILTIAHALLGDEPDGPLSHDAHEVAALYATAAISTVVPRRLADVPIDRIITARRTLAAEFDAFSAHLESMAERFTEIARIESPEVLAAQLKILVERDLRQPTADLKAGLLRLGMEPMTAVLGMNSLQLPATTAAIVAGAGVPVAVGQTGMAAAQLIASGVRAHRSGQAMRRSAAGYLLGLRVELDPQGIVDRVRRTVRHASFAIRG